MYFTGSSALQSMRTPLDVIYGLSVHQTAYRTEQYSVVKQLHAVWVKDSSVIIL